MQPALSMPPASLKCRQVRKKHAENEPSWTSNELVDCKGLGGE